MRGNFETDRSGENNSNYKDGRKHTRLYSIYNNMKTRCYNPNSSAYQYYGARGVTICNEWLSDFAVFREWALNNGYRDDLTIDRIDVDGDYTPDNCRWADYKTQANNMRSNHLIEYHGITKTLKEWSEYFGINDKTVRDRLVRGWDPISAITKPARPLRR